MRRNVAVWFPVAAIIGGAAAVSIGVLAHGRLSETDGRIIVSAIAALLCGGAALAAVELIERRQLRPLAWLALIGTIAEFTIIELAVWTFVDESENRYMRWGWTAVAWLGPTLVIPTFRLLMRDRRLLVSGLLLVALCAVAFAGFLTGIIWTGGDHDVVGRITAALGILGVAGYLVMPALSRGLLRANAGRP